MSKHVNVLALTRYGRQAASSRHRFLNYIPLLEERGVTVTAAPLLDDSYVTQRVSGGKTDFTSVILAYGHRISELATSHRFDVVWIEGELFPRLPALAERLLTSFRIPYVVDLDDAIFHAYDRHPSPLYRSLLGHKIDVILNRAAAVVVGNKYLAQRAVQAGARQVSIVPTSLDERAYTPLKRAAGDRLTLTWIGSPITAPYLASVKTELSQLCRTLPAALKLIGLDQPPFPCTNVVVRKWSEESEAQEVASCDIGLAPLVDGPWERGKCGFKAVQYMAAGLPVLAAHVGAQSDIVTHGETGFLYRNGAEFTAFAKQLAADGELRSRLGAAGRQRVAADFSIHRWSETLRSTLIDASLQRERWPRATVVPRDWKAGSAQKGAETEQVRAWGETAAGELHPKCRILFVISTLALGGTERHLSLIAPALHKRGYGVTIYNTSGIIHPDVRTQIEAAGINILGLREGDFRPGVTRRTARAFAASAGLLRAYVSERPDIVHFYLPEAYLIGAPLARVVGLPIRVMSRRSLNNYQTRRPLISWGEQRLHRSMTAVLANSKQVLNELHDDEGVPTDKLALIYNGICLEDFDLPLDHKGLRRRLGLSNDTLVLTKVANLISYKGYSDLLTALARIKSELPKDWVLLSIGRDDGIGSGLTKEVTKLGLTKHIRFLGERSDVYKLLRISNIGLLCSHEEGFSNALLEGMAAGLPMIATDIGGNPEAVIDGVTGLLVPAEAPDALACAILRLAGNPALAQQMGMAGRARVQQNFGLDACVNRYDAFYRGIMGCPPPAGEAAEGDTG